MCKAGIWLHLISIILILAACGGSGGGGGGDDDDDDDGTATVTSCDGSTLTDFNNTGMTVTIVNNAGTDRDNLPDISQESSTVVEIDCSGGCNSDDFASIFIECNANDNDATLWCEDGNIAGLVNLSPLEGVLATCITGTVECSLDSQVTGGMTLVCENP